MFVDSAHNGGGEEQTLVQYEKSSGAGGDGRTGEKASYEGARRILAKIK